MIESEDVQDLGVGCIRNDAVLLFDVEKHKTGAANVSIYIRSLITHSGGWEFFRFQRNTTDGQLSSSDSLHHEIWWVKLPLAALSFILLWSMELFWPAKEDTFFYEFKGSDSCSNTINCNWDWALCESLYKQNQCFCLYVLLGHRKPKAPVQGKGLCVLK